MAASEADVQDLADQCDRIGGSLQRSWLLQVVLATSGLLYISESQPALALRDALPQDLQLVTALVAAAFFLATLYLFPGFGYWLGRYFMARQALLRHMQAGRRPRSMHGETPNLALFRSVSRLIDSAAEARRRPDTEDDTVLWLRLPPIVIVMAFVLSISVLNNALSVYFTYVVAEPWVQPLRILAATAIGGLLLGWYSLQLYEGMSRITRTWFASVWIMSASSFSLAALLLTMDPLGSL